MTSSSSNQLNNLWADMTPADFKIKLLNKYGEQTEYFGADQNGEEKSQSFVETVFDEIKAAGFSGYTSLTELDWDIGIRACTLHAMYELNLDHEIQYATSTSTLAANSSAFWQNRALKIIQNQNHTATEAIRELFTRGATLDCERAADACVLKGVAEAFACNGLTEQFDALYTTTPMELKHRGWHAGQPLSQLPTKFIDSEKESILPGDRRYFTNLENYLSYNPRGFASGEHTVYMGKNQQDEVYQAISLNNPFNRDKMLLFLAYNYDIDQKAFQNFLYEQLGQTDRHTPWKDFFPRIDLALVESFKQDCANALATYTQSIVPKKITPDNLKDHLPDLLRVYMDDLCDKIDQDNKTGKYKMVRRIDTLELLKMVHILKPDAPKITMDTPTPK